MSLIDHSLEVALPADESFELHISVAALVLIRSQKLHELLATKLGLCLIRPVVNLRILHFGHHVVDKVGLDSDSFLSGLLGVWSDRKGRYIGLNVLLVPSGSGNRSNVRCRGLNVQISPHDLRIFGGCSGLLLLVVFLKTALLLVHLL